MTAEREGDKGGKFRTMIYDMILKTPDLIPLTAARSRVRLRITVMQFFFYQLRYRALQSVLFNPNTCPRNLVYD